MSFDPFRTSVQPYPVTDDQPTYFLAENFTDAKEKLRYDYFNKIKFEYFFYLVNMQRLFHDHLLFIIIHIHKQLK